MTGRQGVSICGNGTSSWRRDLQGFQQIDMVMEKEEIYKEGWGGFLVLMFVIIKILAQSTGQRGLPNFCVCVTNTLLNFG